MKKVFATALIFAVLGGITIAIYLYSTGYRVNVKKGEITPTGMIAAKSIPDGAQVYVDGVLTTATNGTVTGIKPGTHKLKVVKNGFVTWEKDIEVFEQLVTDITAVLVSKTPRLEPLTSEGANSPVISPTLTKIAYFTKDGKKPGVWVFPLGGNIQVNLFKTAPDVILEDTAKIIFSNGEYIEWSPDEKELLVKVDENRLFTADLASKVFETTTSAELTRKTWNEKIMEKRSLFLSRLALSDEVNKLALDPETVWSPDEKKFMYKEKDGDFTLYKVYNLEKPLPVGEKTNYTVFSVKNDTPQPKVYWYNDSFHLITVEGDIKKENKGSIYLIRIDGTNKTEVYNNTLYSDIAFSTPYGDKIVILTSFRSNNQTDLYAIGIR
ncbi:hypothetical protein A2716_01060 [candidate division WWE3 bacterium RIFCSPHIGHO2_01_FULL_40_23]|uniref:PEGA domain-containing protein n=1 Tax=candidate division WWE3 bacterium RIFCSPLOWO2_01_FULL_41_18 TaxID=1802625 RepID=A0A1F4VEF9_UNCKA|nr:MAG: hypothetical protein A2716_01060 [candidate division WWE3 bacterium RIFCSPHIGHO2_01_FULL_40_23]OGC55577.1 MAG: hypothetical protein A3A78_01330 [candidate division WWE3 bacterium RIFCSPLOWO2_01_FULL_41_18]